MKPNSNHNPTATTQITWSRTLVVGTELTQDGDANSSPQRDLVPDANTLEVGRQLDRIVPTEKPGVQLAHPSCRVGRTELDVEQSWPRCPLTNGVDDVDNLEAEVDTVHLLHLLDQISDLPLDLNLPVAVAAPEQTA